MWKLTNLRPWSRLNCNLEVLVFVERGKPKNPEKNTGSMPRREPRTNSLHTRRRVRESNPGLSTAPPILPGSCISYFFTLSMHKRRLQLGNLKTLRFFCNMPNLTLFRAHKNCDDRIFHSGPTDIVVKNNLVDNYWTRLHKYRDFFTTILWKP